VDTSVTSESSLINIENSTDTSLQPLSTNYTTSISSTTENQSTSPQTTTTTPVSIQSVIDQINFYRKTAILSRIKRCDANMQLNDICESYSFDYNTNLLILQSNIEFNTFQELSSALVDLIIVQKLKKSCSPSHWCLGNISTNDIQFTYDIIRERGSSFCSLQQCHSRLLLLIDSCPKLSNTVKIKRIDFVLFLFQRRLSAYRH
jgi:hypothetical protein